MKHFVLFERKGHWTVWNGKTDEKTAKHAYKKIREKGHRVCHTTDAKLAKAVFAKKPSTKAFNAFAKKNKLKIRAAAEAEPEPQVIRISKSGLARGTTVMDLRTAVDLLFGNSEMTAWVKDKIRERLQAEGFRTKSAEYRLVVSSDDLSKAQKLNYYQNTRQGSFVEKTRR